MPPHCDSIDGPVAVAAAQALERGDVSLVLPFVRKDGEAEVTQAFTIAMSARAEGGDARIVADQWFFETVVRIHRAGEGAPFTGLKPAGLDVGPVIPIAEETISSGDETQLVDFLVDTLRNQIKERFRKMMSARQIADRDRSVEAQREYVEAMLGLEVWSHRLYKTMVGPAHGK